MFKFDFALSSQSQDQNCDKNEHKESENLIWLPSTEIIPSENKFNKYKKIDVDLDFVELNSVTLLCVKPSRILSTIKEKESEDAESILLAERSHSDLIPAKYEGGFKVWECTRDLCNLMDWSLVRGKSVLDLGCGLGFLGISALKLGADTVYFQDYNEDVLCYATIPNVELNDDEAGVLMARCKFYSGDWDSFAELSQLSCDVVLTSETIYNPDNQTKLLNTIERVLKPAGVALVAAKSYYFGVGGSTWQFKKVINEMQKFNVEETWKCSEGVQREILKLTFKKNF